MEFHASTDTLWIWKKGFTPHLPIVIIKVPIKRTCKKGGEDMTRLELLTVLLSIKALLESDNKDKALELINEVISEAKYQGNKTE